ncbi:MAG: hypothetical protein WAQ05_05935 [Rubrivivax sp.]
MDQLSAGFWALLIFAWFAGSIAYRIGSRKGLFARPRPGAQFVERWASGRSGTGLMARLSTARNCLQVQITAQELLVTPQFPFTLGFMPEIYDLDKRIALKSVRKAVDLGGGFARAVEVSYVQSNGQAGTLQLLLKRGEPFIAQLLAARDAA